MNGRVTTARSLSGSRVTDFSMTSCSNASWRDLVFSRADIRQTVQLEHTSQRKSVTSGMSSSSISPFNLDNGMSALKQKWGVSHFSER